MRTFGRGLQFPAFAVSPVDKSIRFRCVLSLQFFRIPLELLAGAERYVAEVIRFGEPAGIFKIGAGGPPGLTGLQPLGMVPGRTRQSRRWSLKPGEILFRQQNVFAVVSEDHS